MIETAIEDGDVVGYEVPMPPESQFSLNWQMLDGFGGNVQVTMRASYISEWPTTMHERAKFIDLAQKNGWTFPGTVKPTATAPAVAAPAAPRVGLDLSQPMGHGAPAQPIPASAPANGNGVQVIKTSSLKVVPRPDGKVDLEFWNAGRQYAEIKAVKSPEQAAAMLASTGAWVPDNFNKAETYQLPVTIEWAPGKPNSKGNPFKDILAIKPA